MRKIEVPALKPLLIVSSRVIYHFNRNKIEILTQDSFIFSFCSPTRPLCYPTDIGISQLTTSINRLLLINKRIMMMMCVFVCSDFCCFAALVLICYVTIHFYLS